jgi:hypothetical protein
MKCPKLLLGIETRSTAEPFIKHSCVCKRFIFVSDPTVIFDNADSYILYKSQLLVKTSDLIP